MHAVCGLRFCARQFNLGGPAVLRCHSWHRTGIIQNESADLAADFADDDTIHIRSLLASRIRPTTLSRRAPPGSVPLTYCVHVQIVGLFLRSCRWLEAVVYLRATPFSIVKFDHKNGRDIRYSARSVKVTTMHRFTVH